MVVIRLSRGGAKKKPFYKIVVTDSRNRRDGRYIEQLGFFNPVARGQEVPLRLDLAKVNSWVEKGAQLSDRVKKLVKDHTKATVVVEEKPVAPKKSKPEVAKAAPKAKKAPAKKAPAAKAAVKKDK